MDAFYNVPISTVRIIVILNVLKKTSHGPLDSIYLILTHMAVIDDLFREPFKYYFADFVRKGGGGVPPKSVTPFLLVWSEKVTFSGGL